MTSPGTYYNPSIKYVAETEVLRGKPLLSEPLVFLILEDGKKKKRKGRAALVEFLIPKKGRGKNRGTESVRVRVANAVFSLAIITWRGKKESHLDAMLEDAEGFSIEFGSDVALVFLRIDMAARCGDPRALGAVSAAEIGLFFQRLVRLEEGVNPASSPQQRPTTKPGRPRR
jgi:hypothetical protein